MAAKAPPKFKEYTLRVKLIDKNKAFKPFKFNPSDTVRNACLRVAEATATSIENYGLFLPGNEESVGQWLREDYPLDFYGFEGEEVRRVRESKGGGNDPSKKSADYLEWRNKLRYVKVSLDSVKQKGVLVDDTTKVNGLIDAIGGELGFGIAITEETLFEHGDDRVEILSNDMTLREQGYHGECNIGLYTKVRGSQKRSDMGLFIKLPYFEGYLSRKGGGLSSWKKRWYVLRKNKLHNYKSEKDLKKELGHVLIKTCKEIKKTPASLSDVPKKQQHCCFEIVTSARNYKMLSKSQEDKENWMNELELARRMFGDESDLEDVLTRERKKLEKDYESKKSAEETAQKEKEERERLEKDRKEKEERQKKEAEERRQKEEEERRKRQEELDRRRREEEEIYLQLTAQESQMEREFNELEEELRELEALKSRELDDQMFKLLAEQEADLEEELKRMEKELNSLESQKQSVADRMKRQEDVVLTSRQADEEADPEAEKRLQEEAERKRQEEEEQKRLVEEEKEKKRQEDERRREEKKRREEERQRLLEEQRAREEDKRRQKLLEEEEQRRREEEEIMRLEEEARLKEAEDLFQQLEEEARELEMQQRKQEEEERRRKREEEEKKRRQDEEEKRRVEEEQRRAEEEERRKTEEEERRKREEERKKREEEAARKIEEERQRLAEERKRREEEDRQKWEEELRKREEEEVERFRQEEELLKELEREAEEERVRQQQEEEEEEERLRVEEEEREREVQAALAAETAAETAQGQEDDEESIISGDKTSLFSEERVAAVSKVLQGTTPIEVNRGENSTVTSQERSLLLHVLQASNKDDESALKPSVEVLESIEAGDDKQVWSAIKKTVMSAVSVEKHPELSFIVEQTSVAPASAATQESTASTDPEAILKSWANYHLKCTGSDRQVTNFEKDFEDGQVMTLLLNQLEPDLCDVKALTTEDKKEKIQCISENLSNIGVEINPKVIENANHRVNFTVLASVFNALPGLGDIYTEIQSKRTTAAEYMKKVLPEEKRNFSPKTLLQESADAQVLCKMVNHTFGDVIDLRLIDESNSAKMRKENWSLCVNAITMLTGQKFSVPEDSNYERSDVIESLVWEIVEACILAPVNPLRNSALFALKRHNDGDAFVSLPASKLLLRWANYHLKKHNRIITNFTDDFEDCANYIYLLHELFPEKVPGGDANVRSFINDMEDWEERAKYVISVTQQEGCFCTIAPRDILEAENERLTVAFLADLVRVRNGLPAIEQELASDSINSSSGSNISLSSSGKDEQHLTAKKASAEDKAHLEKQEEETQLCNWINGLGLELATEVKDLEADLSDGIVLLKIMAKAKPEFVDSKKYATKPKTKFAQIALLEYALDVSKNQFKFPNMRIVASDIAEAKKGSGSVLVKQVKKYMGGSEPAKADHKKKHAQKKAPSSAAKDLFLQSRIRATTKDDILEWINTHIAKTRPGVTIKSIEDPQINTLLFLDILSSALPAGEVNRALIAAEGTVEGDLNNARLLLGIVWKSGIPVTFHPRNLVRASLEDIQLLSSTLLVYLSVKNKMQMK
eukprot:TRINITY_DN3464_c0_g1_i1.p1 TRINITY_DN3464_c0_g1~~TRINITY_DN3464_c0_g1_i1.p1  ORF type:complete len:1580 (+),score=959.31 TRINITY_DN3464_c0_g1_i1:84-4742(+)